MKKMDRYIRIGDILYRELREEIAKDEEELLQCWLEKKENRDFFMSLKNSNRLYEDLLDMQYMDTEAYLCEVEKRILKRRRVVWWKWIPGIAAAIVLAVGVFSWLKKTEIKSGPVTCIVSRLPERGGALLRTTTGTIVMLADTVRTLNTTVHDEDWKKDRQREVVEEVLPYNVLETFERGNIDVALCDNTRVWLNAGSVLKYPNEFKGSTREIYLEGEAYFEVTRNTGKPFIVKTSKGQIEVLGTEFNVKVSTSESCVTTLVRGCVKIRGVNEDSVTIYPGQQVIDENGKKMKIKEVDTRYFTAWRENLFAFHEETLYSILFSLSEWYGCSFSIETKELANMRFTTMIEKAERIGDVLEILQRTGNFSYMINEDGEIKIRAVEK